LSNRLSLLISVAKCWVLSKTGEVKFNVTAVVFLFFLSFLFFYIYSFSLSFLLLLFLQDINFNPKTWTKEITVETLGNIEGRYKTETKIQSLNVQNGSIWLIIKCNAEFVRTRQYSRILGFHKRIKLSSLNEWLLKIVFHGVRQVINYNN